MSNALLGISGRTAAALAAIAIFLPVQAFADFDPPARPKIDCTKPGNKNKPACKNNHGQLSDDEIYNAAYWMARGGQYREALALLARAKNKNDPRVLNATGFATRKLGDVDGALPYYARALEINPNYTVAREYMGEALLAKGNVGAARTQLGEIEKRCGTACAPYAELSRQIASFEVQHAQPSSGG
jgi:tetratricopeptide (TPR) repeat protein